MNKILVSFIFAFSLLCATEISAQKDDKNKEKIECCCKKCTNVTLIVLTVVIAKTIRTVTNAKIAIIKDIAANNITIDIIIKADVVKGAVDL